MYSFTDSAWEDYGFWQQEDIKILKCINCLTDGLRFVYKTEVNQLEFLSFRNDIKSSNVYGLKY